MIDVETGFDAGSFVDITVFQNAGNVTGTTGLAAGPDSVEGGIYANTLFVSNSNTLYAFDLNGEGQRILVDGATSVPFGAGGVTGIDFGTLDRNLWHVSGRRSNDGTRGSAAAGGAQPGGSTLYFGNEIGGTTAGNKNNRAATTINDYNFPGGAHGTLESEPFSLVGYSAEDRPVLYFNYHFATADTADDNDTSPNDTLRVWIAGPDGSYELLATNNTNGDGAARQVLFDDTNTADATAEWRQARIQLDEYAGLSDLRLRVDFTTTGRIRTGSANLVGDELRAVAASAIADADTFTIDGNVFEFERGYTIEAPTGLRINDGDQFVLDGATYEFTLAGGTGNIDVVFNQNMTAREVATAIENALTGQGIAVFRPNTGTRLNIPDVMLATDDAALPTTFLQGQFDQQTLGSEIIFINSTMTENTIAGLVRQAVANVFAEQDINVIKAYDNVVRVIGHTVGAQGPLGLSQLEADPGDVVRRGVDNAFEGIYLDDFIVGLTERGEEASQGVGNSGYAANGNPQAITGGASSGDYQLEIRRSHEHLLVGPPDGIDSNQRNLQGVTITTQSGIDYSDGDQFVIADGLRSLTFEFDDNSVNDGVAAGIVEVGFLSTFTADQIAESIRDAINATSTQNILDVRGLSGDGPDSGTASTSSLVHLVGNAVSDNFGNTNFAVTPGLALSFEVHDRRGDANLLREQGQIIVQGNQITDAEQYGIDVQAGVRNPGIVDNGGNIPHPGSPIRFEEPNAEDLVPGVVVINNVVANSGTGGIRFGGTADTSQNAPTPFGRIVNNTVFGGGSGIGIRVENNASPTLLNNLLADLATGI